MLRPPLPSVHSFKVTSPNTRCANVSETVTVASLTTILALMDGCLTKYTLRQCLGIFNCQVSSFSKNLHVEPRPGSLGDFCGTHTHTHTHTNSRHAGYAGPKQLSNLFKACATSGADCRMLPGPRLADLSWRSFDRKPF